MGIEELITEMKKLLPGLYLKAIRELKSKFYSEILMSKQDLKVILFDEFSWKFRLEKDITAKICSGN